jgi:hypothetical protein
MISNISILNINFTQLSMGLLKQNVLQQMYLLI